MSPNPNPKPNQVPRCDLEALLPHQQVRMPPMQRASFAAMGVLWLGLGLGLGLGLANPNPNPNQVGIIFVLLAAISLLHIKPKFSSAARDMACDTDKEAAPEINRQRSD